MQMANPIDEKVRIQPASLRRQTDEFSDGIRGMLTDPTAYMMIMIANIIAIFLIPFAFFILVPLGIFYFRYVAKQQYRLKFRMPLEHGYYDYSAPYPGQLGAPKKFKKGTGILYVGSELSTGKMLFLSDDDARRHGFCLGTTGSGKALPLSAMILTAHRGWLRNEDLEVGDVLFHPYGGTSKVTDIFPQAEQQAGARIMFADGRLVDCSGDHLWSVVIRDRVPNPIKGTFEAEEKLMTASDIAILHETSGDKKEIFVPLARPLEMTGHLPRDGDVLELERNGLDTFSGSLAQTGTATNRRRFLSEFLYLRSQKTLMREHDLGLMIKCKSEEEAHALRDIFWSLGGVATAITDKAGSAHVAGMVPDMQEIWPSIPAELLALLEIGLKVVEVEALSAEQPMQCIKIDRPDGLFVTDNFVVTHNTELLLGIIAQPLMWSSGFMFVDGKGTQEFYNRVWSVARRFGREDDIRVINFTSDGSDPDAPAGGFTSQSNTMNPFAKGTADQLINLLASLMPQSQGQDMWRNRAVSLVNSVMRTLVDMRDAGDILLDVQTIRDFLPLGVGVKVDKSGGARQKRDVGYADVSSIPDADWEDIKNRPGLIELYLRALNGEFSEQTKLSLTAFFETLPSFSLDKALRGQDQESKAIEQLGYLTMQLTGPLGLLADSYSHIFKTPMGETDIFDVVLNRRILIALLPTLQKEEEEVQNCGRVIISMVKLMMGASGNSRLQGLTKELVEASPTKSISPFIIVLDEAGYYLVNGVDVILAQARSYGVMAIVAGQDISAMQKVSTQLAETAAANARISMIGATEDASKSLEFVMKKFGKRMTAVNDRMDVSTGLFSKKYYNNMSVGFQEQDVVSGDQLQTLQSGQFYFAFEGEIVLANTPFIGTERDREANVNRFLKVRGPTDDIPGRDQVEEKAFVQAFIEQSSALLDPKACLDAAKSAFGHRDGTFLSLEDRIAVASSVLHRIDGDVPELEKTMGVLLALSRRPDVDHPVSEDELAELTDIEKEMPGPSSKSPRIEGGGLDMMSEEEVMKNAGLKPERKTSAPAKPGTDQNSTPAKSADKNKSAAFMKGEALHASIFGEQRDERLRAMNDLMRLLPVLTKKMNATISDQNGRLEGALSMIDLDGAHALKPLEARSTEDLAKDVEAVEKLVEAA